MPTYQLPGLHATNHSFEVPLDYAKPKGDALTLFARELVATEKQQQDLPYLVYFQGGPGFGAPRPQDNSGWLKRALQEFRVLLLDQRGTGASTPVDVRALAELSPSAQAEYLTHFRADNIVRDAEQIRRELIGADTPWSVLGQSFGGFCVMRYLSAAPEGLKEAYITGGIPSLTRPAEDVYRATYPQVKAKNQRFFTRYPHAQALCQEIADYLLEYPITLPNGQRLTALQFQQLGLVFGASVGLESVYYALEHAFITVNGKRTLSTAFLHSIFSASSFHAHPIFAILHEAIYCQDGASDWAAERVREEFPEFNYAPGKPFLFTGEMIYPWMFEQYATLKPLKEAAEILARKDNWPQLYDLDVLSKNQVLVAAAVYFNDMYVDVSYTLETVRQIPNIRTWVTSEYEHNGLRADGERVLDTLITLLRGPA